MQIGTSSVRLPKIFFTSLIFVFLLSSLSFRSNIEFMLKVGKTVIYYGKLPIYFSSFSLFVLLCGGSAGSARS